MKLLRSPGPKRANAGEQTLRLLRREVPYVVLSSGVIQALIADLRRQIIKGIRQYRREPQNRSVIVRGSDAVH